jgi:hypothetical protein
MDGSHDSLGFLFRERPDVFGMSPRDHERVSARYLSFVEEGDRALVLIHSPRRQRPIENFAEGTIHRTMIAAERTWCGISREARDFGNGNADCLRRLARPLPALPSIPPDRGRYSEPRKRNRGRFQWAGQGLNLRHPACKASALPLSYPPGRGGESYYAGSPFASRVVRPRGSGGSARTVTRRRAAATRSGWAVGSRRRRVSRWRRSCCPRRRSPDGHGVSTSSRCGDRALSTAYPERLAREKPQSGLRFFYHFCGP